MRIIPFQRLGYSDGEHWIDSPNGPMKWLVAFSNKDNIDLTDELIVSYLCGETIVDCLEPYAFGLYVSEFDRIMDWFIEALAKIPVVTLSSRLRNKRYALVESPENVPQISSFESSTLGILDVLAAADVPLSYATLGYQLYDRVGGRSIVARRKYGENASKFAALLDLVHVGRDVMVPDARDHIGVRLSTIGRALQRYNGDKMGVVARLMFHSAMFRDIVCSDDAHNVETFRNTVDRLEQKTRRRRCSAFSGMLRLFSQYGGIIQNEQATEDLLCHMRA